MANCPNCGSSHIQIKNDTTVNWGRAVAGWALFGVVGGAVAAMTGEDKSANACLDCGTVWKAADLYKTLEIIEKTTNKKLDLSQNSDRQFMNNFMREIGPYLKQISSIQSEADKK
ncbi:MAG: hypothetical protein AAGF26_14730, partial [Cyanobacteria bacterium P01_G01_bin.49]